MSSVITDLHQALSENRICRKELTQIYLERIKKSDINAFICCDEEVAYKAIDRNTIETQSVLSGIPIAHKDVFVTTSFPTTAASKMLADYKSPFDATIVQKLANHGAICLGKTNCDEFAMGSANEHSYFGAVRNPWNPDFVSGGSSGGSAAAVAAGLIPYATASDTGGSIRQPAALCGVSGIKPTYGRASRFGMIAYASSLDQPGVIATSAHDCALALHAMCGSDANDQTSLAIEVPNFIEQIDKPIKGLKIGRVSTLFAEPLASEQKSAIDNALLQLEQAGAIVVDIEVPYIDLAVAAYYIIACAEASSNLSRYDGIRYGYRDPESSDWQDLYLASRSQGFGEEVKRRIMLGTFVLSHGYYDAYYQKAQKIRRLIAQSYIKAFQQCDVMITPVTPSGAWKIGSHSSPTTDYLADLYTLPVNLAGLPAASFPVGFSRQGAKLPIGMQVIGNYLDEATILQIGKCFQNNTTWHQESPLHAYNPLS